MKNESRDEACDSIQANQEMELKVKKKSKHRARNKFVDVYHWKKSTYDTWTKINLGK